MKIAIIGASARAAAASAKRAGAEVTAIDLFGDLDLQRVAQCRLIERQEFPRAFQRHVDALREGHWMYAGGLENYPEIIESLCNHTGETALLGNPGRVLRRVRNPFDRDWKPARQHEESGFRLPENASSPDGLPTDGAWLLKPKRSGGGREIEPWLGQERLPGEWFWQKRVDGDPCSAVYVGGGGGAKLLGTTRLWCGKTFSNAQRFWYCGGVTEKIDAERRDRFQSAGNWAVDVFGLSGVFGIDFVDAGELLHVVEINPRYPATAELHERRTSASVFSEHAASFGVRASVVRRDGAMSSMHFAEDAAPFSQFPDLHFGKAILYSPAPCFWDEREAFKVADALGVELADVPNPGASFVAGNPVVTVLADDADSVSLENRLAAACRTIGATLIPDW